MVSSASLESYGHFLLKACCNQLDLGKKMLGIVSTLIGKGADVNARDDYGNTPLHWACHALRKLDADEQATTMPYGLRLVLLLLQNGANKEACNHRGWTPLHYAARSGNEVAVNLLIHGVAKTVEKRRRQTAPLRKFLTGTSANSVGAEMATIFQVDRVRERLWASVQVGHATKQVAMRFEDEYIGETFLQLSENVSKTLKANVNLVNVGMGHYVYKKEHIADYQFMGRRVKNMLCVPIFSTNQISRDADENDKNDHEEKEIIGMVLLINKLPRRDAAGNILDFDLSTVHFDEADCHKIYDVINGVGAFNVVIEMMEKLDASVAYVINNLFSNIKDYARRRFQFVADDEAVIHDAHEEPGFVSDSVYDKQRCMFASLNLGNSGMRGEHKVVDTLRAMLNAGVDSSSLNRRTPMMEAAISGQSGVVKILLDSGANPYHSDSNGNTLLHIAASLGNNTLAQILCGAMCDPFEMNHAKQTPRQVCDVHLLAYFKKLEAKWPVLRAVTNGSIERIFELWKQTRKEEHGVKHSGQNTMPEDARIAVNSFFKSNTFVFTHLLLHAVEVIWLRVLNEGHINTWHDTEFERAYGHRLLVPQSDEPCPIRGLKILCQAEFSLPIPKRPFNVSHSVFDDGEDSSMLVELKFDIDRSNLVTATQYLVYSSLHNGRDRLIAHYRSIEFPIIYSPSTEVNKSTDEQFRFQLPSAMRNNMTASDVNHLSFTVVAENIYGQSSPSLPSARVESVTRPTSWCATHLCEEDSVNVKPSITISSKREYLLRCESAKTAEFIERGMKPFLLSEDRGRRRGEDLASKTLVSYEQFHALEFKSLDRLSQETDDMRIPWTYHGSEQCFFEVTLNANGSGTNSTSPDEVVAKQNDPGFCSTFCSSRLEVPRGWTTISFRFFEVVEGSKRRAHPIYKSRKCAYITIAPLYIESDERDSSEEVVRIPISSGNVVLTKATKGFGNDCLSVFLPSNTFRLSSTTYSIQVDEGALEIGHLNSLRDHQRKPCEMISRYAIVNRSQVLWNRVGHCPRNVRELVNIQLQWAQIPRTPFKVDAKNESSQGYMVSPILRSHCPSKISVQHTHLTKLWQSKERASLRETKTSIECHVCNHVTEPLHFPAQVINKTPIFHPEVVDKCTCCGHIQLSGDNRLLAMSYIRSRRKFPLQQMEIIKNPSKAALFFGLTEKSMSLTRRLPSLLLSSSEEEYLSQNQENDLHIISQSGHALESDETTTKTIQKLNYKCTWASKNKQIVWPECLLHHISSTYLGHYPGPFLISTQVEQESEDYSAGIVPYSSDIEETELHESEDSKMPSSIPIQLDETKSGISAEKVTIVSPTKVEREDGINDDKIGLEDEDKKQEEREDSGSFFSFFCASRRPSKSDEVKPSRTKPMVDIMDVSGSGIEEAIGEDNGVEMAREAEESEEEEDAFGELDYEVNFEIATYRLKNEHFPEAFS